MNFISSAVKKTRYIENNEAVFCTHGKKIPILAKCSLKIHTTWNSPNNVLYHTKNCLDKASHFMARAIHPQPLLPSPKRNQFDLYK